MLPYTIAKPLPKFTPGPWDSEPNTAEWEAFGLPCAIIRTQMGHLCGYVGVPKGHPFYERNSNMEIYKRVEISSKYVQGFGYIEDLPISALGLEVHGGITYKNLGDDNGFWWFGFDCAHSGDLVPALRETPIRRGGKMHNYDIFGKDREYRNFAFATHETNSLAEQLSKIEPDHFDSL